MPVMMNSANKPEARSLGLPAIVAFVALASLAMAYAGIELTRETGRIAAIWASNALCLVVLLRSPDRRAPAILGAFAVGNTAANVLAGDPLWFGAVMAPFNLAEILVCFAGLRRLGDHDLTRPRTLLVFSLLAAGPATILSGLLAASTFALLDRGEFWPTFGTWHAADALGLVTFAPLFAAVADAWRDGLPTGRTAITTAGAAVAFCVVLALVFLQQTYPLLFAVMPAMMWVTIQFGFLGAAVALVATALVALVATAEGHGPIALVTASLREQIVCAQLFVAACAFMSLQVAAVLMERDRLIERIRATNREAEAARESFRDSEARYRLLAENASDVIVRRDAMLRAVYVSPSVERLFGHSPEEYRSLPLMDLVHPDDRASVMRELSLLGPNRPRAVIQKRARTRGGEWIWVEASYDWLAGDGSSGPTTIAVLRDVTERKAVDEALEGARRAKEEAVAERAEFLSLMSHELRTPLNAVVGFSELLAEGGEVRSDEGCRQLRNVCNSARAMLAIVNDVMDVTRIDAGAVTLASESFDPRALCAEAVELVRLGAEAKGLTLTASIEDRVPARLLGDEARLRQVLLNLLSNAVRFTDAGSVTLRVGVGGAGDDGRVPVRFSVHDTGIGIPEDRRGRLFKRFSQVDPSPSRRFGGTGLGLYICKGLVGLMGGELVVDSREGVGSTFSFAVSLPEAEAEADAFAVAAPGLPRASHAAIPDIGQVRQPRPVGEEDGMERPMRLPTGGLRVLVAEDRPLNRELVGKLLAAWGHEATFAADGFEAVRAAAEDRFDAILMDVQMPGMDGIQATRRIRASEAPGTRVPIFAVTADVRGEDADLFRAAGIDAVLAKPFEPRALLRLLDGLSPTTDRRPGGAERPTDGAILDEGKLDDLVGLLGAPAVGRFLRELSGELAAGLSLDAPPQILARRAHALASMSGMLGFAGLGQACRSLEAEARKGAAGQAADEVRSSLATARDELARLLEQPRFADAPTASRTG